MKEDLEPIVEYIKAFYLKREVTYEEFLADPILNKHFNYPEQSLLLQDEEQRQDALKRIRDSARNKLGAWGFGVSTRTNRKDTTTLVPIFITLTWPKPK